MSPEWIGLIGIIATMGVIGITGFIAIKRINKTPHESKH